MCPNVSSQSFSRPLGRYYSGGHDHHEEPEIPLPAFLAPNASVEVLFGPSKTVDSEYWSDPLNWDPHDYEWKCKVELLLYDWYLTLSAHFIFF